MRLIDADKAVELLRNLGSRDYRREKGTIMYAMKMLSYSVYTPTVDAAPVVHGRWDRSGYCSECDFWTCYCGDYNYCPNCGAKMDLEVE